MSTTSTAGSAAPRFLEPDPVTGQRRFTGQAFSYAGYQSCHLACAITGHSAQGATVHTGIALVTGSEDRQWLYPAMTRGTEVRMRLSRRVRRSHACRMLIGHRIARTFRPRICHQEERSEVWRQSRL
jgi:hypothetical protein